MKGGQLEERKGCFAHALGALVLVAAVSVGLLLSAGQLERETGSDLTARQTLVDLSPRLGQS